MTDLPFVSVIFAEFISTVNENVFKISFTTDVVLPSKRNSSGYLSMETAEFSFIAAEITIIVRITAIFWICSYLFHCNWIPIVYNGSIPLNHFAVRRNL